MKWFVGEKRTDQYRGLLIKADLGLHEQVASELVARVSHGGHVLDLGAGEGALSARLADRGFVVTAVDKDHSGFRFEDCTFVTVDFDDAQEFEVFVEESGGRFDAVLSIEVIEHLQDQWRYVRQLIRMTKPGGILIVTTPNTTSWLSRWHFFLKGRFHQFSDSDLDYGHISPVTAWELELILLSSGAEDVTIRPAGTLPPIYAANRSLKTFALSLASLSLRPLQRGILDGWCIMAIARRPK